MLLHFFISARPWGGGGGEKREVRERLLRVSECSLLLPPPLRLLPAPSSSEGSMESWYGQPGLVLPPLLWLRWCRLMFRRVKIPRPLKLCLREAGESGTTKALWVAAGGTGHNATGRSSAHCGESLRFKLSSSVVCRLPSEMLLLLSSREVSLSVVCRVKIQREAIELIS